MQSIKDLLKKLTSPINEPVSAAEQDVDTPVDADTYTAPSVSNGVDHTTSKIMTEKNQKMVIMRETVYDLIKDIKDPEKPQTLEELNVVSEDDVTVEPFADDKLHVKIVFVPTVPHCSLASLIGLCLRHKLVTCFPEKIKLDILVKQGTHETADEINKQINDKERIAAAMENPNLRDLVEKCINDEDGYG